MTRRKHLKFSEAREHLKEGDVLLFRGTGIVSFFIKRASEGKYSHVGVASAVGSNGSTIWECVEFREGKGGRTVNLEQYVKQHSGTIDVYRPKSEIRKAFFEKNKAKRICSFYDEASPSLQRAFYAYRQRFYHPQPAIPG